MKLIMRSMLVAIIVSAVPAVLLAVEEAQQTCAVMSFEATDVDQPLASATASRFSVLLSEEGPYIVVPRLEVNRELSAGRYTKSAYASPYDAGIAAGKLLKVDLVVVGTVEKNADGYSLSISLLDVKEKKVLKRGRTTAVASRTDFERKAARRAVDYLIGPREEARKPAVAAPVTPTPPAQPVQPAPEPPKVVKKETPVAVEPKPEAPKKPIPPPAPEVAPPPVQPVEPVVKPAEPAVSEDIIKAPTPVVVLAEPPLDEPGAMPDEFEPPPARVDSTSLSAVMDFLADRLVIGTRSTTFALKETEKDTFVGSINQLEDIQNSAPTKLYADFYFTEWLGVEISRDRIEAKTITKEQPEVPRHTDGNYVLAGPTLSLVGRYRNRTPLTPYAGVGVAMLSGSFDHAPWWNLGYSSEEEWLSQGSPSTAAPTPKGEYVRTMTLDDATGTIGFAGCDYRIWRNLYVDVYLRYMKAESDSSYYLTHGGDLTSARGPFTVPFDNWAWGIGAGYAF